MAETGHEKINKLYFRVLPPNTRDGQLGHPNSSGYDSTDEELIRARSSGLRAARSEDFLRHTGGSRERRGKSYTRNARESSTGRRYHRDEESWTQRERRLKAHSEANLMTYDIDDHPHQVSAARRLSRSNGHLSHLATGSSRDLLRGGAFVNRGMEEDEDEEELLEERIAMEEEQEERMRRARSASR